MDLAGGVWQRLQRVLRLRRLAGSFGRRTLRRGRRVQTELGADVDGDVGVEGQVLPRDCLIFNRVHAVQLPGLTRLGQHVEPGSRERKRER